MAEIIWRFLVIDDRKAGETQELLEGIKLFEPPDKVIVEKCEKFSDALVMLSTMRFDLVILDLRDDSIELEEVDEPLAGEKVFEQIKNCRFIPVIFYTAYPEKVKYLENPYVRVTKRGQERKLRDAIISVFATGIPRFSRHIEEEQREYMWDYIPKFWKENQSEMDNTDLIYLLARRLANSLERNSIRRFLTTITGKGLQPDDPTFHPIEMYIYPPISKKLIAGDILHCIFDGKDGYWFILTPTCDLEHEKVETVVLAECFLLSEQPEYERIKNQIKQKQPVQIEDKRNLIALIRNNRNLQSLGQKTQPTRFIFLPGTFFLPDLVIDFQAIKQVPLPEVKEEFRVASMDSPFSESYLSKFASYYGRLGTPDINHEFVYQRILGN